MDKKSIKYLAKLVADFHKSQDSAERLNATRALLLNIGTLSRQDLYPHLNKGERLLAKWLNDRFELLIAGGCCCEIFGSEKPTAGRPQNDARDREIYRRIVNSTDPAASDSSRIQFIADLLRKEGEHYLSESAVRTIFYRQKKLEHSSDIQQATKEFEATLKSANLEDTVVPNLEQGQCTLVEMLKHKDYKVRRDGIKRLAVERIYNLQKAYGSSLFLTFCQKILKLTVTKERSTHDLEVLSKLAKGLSPNQAYGWDKDPEEA